MVSQYGQHVRTERPLVRVAVYPADVFGCGHFRMLYPARVLRAAGHDVSIHLPTKPGMYGEVDPETGRTTGVKGLPEGVDVVVLQRVSHKKLSSAVSQIRRQGVAVVVDMDDDLSCIHPANPAHRGLHPATGGAYSWQAAAQACRDATLTTVSTPALAHRYPSRDNGAHILDNYVPEFYHRVTHDDVPAEVGYAGSLHSHPDDVPQVGFSMAELVSEGTGIRIVGGGPDGFADALGIPEDPETSGALHIDDWPAAVARLGVGIAPLADTKFNEAKSRLKVLEMSALGVPWVASPRAEYHRFHRETGVGFLARRPRDWYRHLHRLVRDPDMRADQSESGREATRALTYERNAWRWMEAWERAHALERGRKPATYPGVR